MILNKEQQEVVDHINGPLMVMAGAGSGKTRALTERIVNLINKGVPPRNILAVTFTNKAAKEMKERIEEKLKFDSFSMWISTFHSMCAKILRMDIDKIGYTLKFEIIDAQDSIKIVKNILKEMNLDSKTYVPKKIYYSINKIEEDQSILMGYDELFRSIIEKVLKKYREFKFKNNILDFNDLINKTIELFKKTPIVLTKYQNKFSYLMVDEFQDTNTLQFELLQLLAGDNTNIFVVGDLNQSIYKFRGAKIENINNFIDIFKPKIIKLEENYRSTKNILDAANSVIKNNNSIATLKLRTLRKGGQKVCYYRAPTSYAETNFVIEQINLLKRNGYKFKDIAILYRANAMSRQFEEVFNSNLIDYKIHGGTSFLDRVEIKNMVAYLNLIVNKDSNWSYKRVINVPKRGFGDIALMNMEIFADSVNLTMFNAIEKASARFSKKVCEKLNNFKKVIEDIADKLEDIEVENIIDLILDKSGYKVELDSKGFEGSNRLDNIYELKNMIKESKINREEEQVSNYAILSDLIYNIGLKMQDKQVQTDDYVSLMTIHSSKGLEFPFIFMVGVEEGIFPSVISMQDKSELEEERRLCYVAMTRAKEILYITNAQSRMKYGDIQNNRESIFISEIGKNYIKNFNYEKAFDEMPKKYLKESNEDFAISDKLEHKTFGKGVVVAVSGDIITIAFDAKFGIKKLMKNHKAITKL